MQAKERPGSSALSRTMQQMARNSVQLNSQEARRVMRHDAGIGTLSGAVVGAGIGATRLNDLDRGLLGGALSRMRTPKRDPGVIDLVRIHPKTPSVRRDPLAAAIVQAGERPAEFAMDRNVLRAIGRTLPRVPRFGDALLALISVAPVIAGASFGAAAGKDAGALIGAHRYLAGQHQEKTASTRSPSALTRAIRASKQDALIGAGVGAAGTLWYGRKIEHEAPAVITLPLQALLGGTMGYGAGLAGGTAVHLFQQSPQAMAALRRLTGRGGSEKTAAARPFYDQPDKTEPTSDDYAAFRHKFGKSPDRAGVGLRRDKNGVFVHTHRARSKSYPSADAIPQKVVRFIESTGAAETRELLKVAASRFERLKKNQVDLTPEERAEVYRRKAVWHRYMGTGTNRKHRVESAVWKSVNARTGEATYVTNTHRAYQTAPTLKGAIGWYHRFIKSTA